MHAVARLLQLEQGRARLVARRGEDEVRAHHRGRDVGHLVGHPVVAPEELAVARAHAHEAAAEELHVLLHARRRSRPRSRSSAAPSLPFGPRSGMAVFQIVWPVFLSTATRAASRAPGGEDQAVAVHERRLAELPHRHHGAAEVAGQALAPALLARWPSPGTPGRLRCRWRRAARRRRWGCRGRRRTRRARARRCFALQTSLPSVRCEGEAPAGRRPGRRWCRCGRPTTATLARSPRPAPLTFQASGGPAAGHSCRSPCSGETASRFGPAPARPVARAAASPAMAATARRGEQAAQSRPGHGSPAFARCSPPPPPRSC